MNELTSIISTVGFPIAVTAYLLVYFRKTIDSLKDVISKNSEIMARLSERLDK